MMNPGISVAAASEVTPINNRTPLMAMAAVQALCKMTKRKLLAATIQE
jgi:hypothetical protein